MNAIERRCPEFETYDKHMLETNCADCLRYGVNCPYKQDEEYHNKKWRKKRSRKDTGNNYKTEGGEPCERGK
jgi:hypothetical protein